MATLLISAQWIKDNGLTGANVDVKVIEPTIEEVQDQFIHPILGTALYEQIKAQVLTTVSSANVTLLDTYIAPCIMRFVEAELQYSNTYKSANKGTVTKNADHSVTPSIGELISVAKERRNKAEWYAQRITNFLEANTATYPLYLNQTRLDAIYPNRTSYQSGIWLGGNEGDCIPEEDRWRRIR
jgi:hypothetical protein